jgi:hypothetical protein
MLTSQVINCVSFSVPPFLLFSVILENLKSLGVPVTPQDKKKKPRNRRKRETNTNLLSRWVPIIKARSCGPLSTLI